MGTGFAQRTNLNCITYNAPIVPADAHGLSADPEPTCIDTAKWLLSLRWQPVAGLFMQSASGSGGFGAGKRNTDSLKANQESNSSPSKTARTHEECTHRISSAMSLTRRPQCQKLTQLRWDGRRTEEGYYRYNERKPRDASPSRKFLGS